MQCNVMQCNVMYELTRGHSETQGLSVRCSNWQSNILHTTRTRNFLTPVSIPVITAVVTTTYGTQRSKGDDSQFSRIWRFSWIPSLATAHDVGNLESHPERKFLCTHYWVTHRLIGRRGSSIFQPRFWLFHTFGRSSLYPDPICEQIERPASSRCYPYSSQ